MYGNNNFGFGASGSNGGGGGGTPVNFIEKTYTEMSALIAGDGLVAGSFYKITDRGDLGIIVQAVSANQITKEGTRIMLCPTGYGTGSFDGNTWIGVWNSTKTANIDDLTIWGGKVWKNLNGNIGAAVDDFTLDAEWQLIDKATFSNGEYVQMIFGVEYDFTLDWINKQWDDKGNIFGVTISNNPFAGVNPVDACDWNYESLNTGGVFFPFYDNVCQGIFNNSNNEAIIGNKVTGFIYNNSNGGVINYNSNTGYITGNTNSGGIYRNSNHGNISTNSCLEIFDNTNNGDIIGNSCTGDISLNSKIDGGISSNSNEGGIMNNSCSSQITSNSNLGNISNNKNIGSIENNTNGIVATPNSGEIYNNSNDGNISSNSNQGQIYKNLNNGDISENSVQGDIYQNQNNGIIYLNESSVAVNIFNNVNNGDIGSSSIPTNRVADVTDPITNK